MFKVDFEPSRILTQIRISVCKRHWNNFVFKSVLKYFLLHDASSLEKKIRFTFRIKRTFTRAFLMSKLSMYTFNGKKYFKAAFINSNLSYYSRRFKSLGIPYTSFAIYTPLFGLWALIAYSNIFHFSFLELSKKIHLIFMRYILLITESN